MSLTTTGLDRENYSGINLPDPNYKIKSIVPYYQSGDGIRGFESEHQSVGLDIHFEIEKLNFNTLTQKLSEQELMSSESSIEMFSRYIRGEIGDEIQIDEWLNLFLLWLGTNEVRQYSCP